MADDDSFNQYMVEYVAFRAANEPGSFPSAHSTKRVFKKREVQPTKWIQMMNFAHRQLEMGKSSMLIEQHIAILSEISFPWVMSPEESWDKGFNDLEAFHLKEGHCDVSFRNDSLGRWVGYQRSLYKAFKSGKPSSITPGRIAKLESIGFKWEVKVDARSKWNAKFEQLLSFEQVNGNCDIPSTYEDKTLANWVNQQRKSYKAKCNDKNLPLHMSKLSN